MDKETKQEIQSAVGKAFRLLRLRKNVSMSKQSVEILSGSPALGQLERGQKDSRLSSLYEATWALELPLGRVFDLADLFSAGAPELEAELKWRHDAMTKKGRPPNT